MSPELMNGEHELQRFIETICTEPTLTASADCGHVSLPAHVCNLNYRFGA